MISYAGASECLICHKTGGPTHEILTTPETRAFAIDLAGHLRALCEVEGRMLGVLRADGRWIVTLSNSAAQSWNFVRMVSDFSADAIPVAHGWATVPKRSLGGKDVSRYIATQVRHGQSEVCFKVDEPLLHGSKRSTVASVGGHLCVCAAPKLISYLTQDAGSYRLPPQELSMVEIWCGADQRHWHHGDIAHSCGFCARILPTLACRATR